MLSLKCLWNEHSAENIQWPGVSVSLERDDGADICAGAIDLKVIKIKMTVETKDVNIITQEEVLCESKRGKEEEEERDGRWRKRKRKEGKGEKKEREGGRGGGRNVGAERRRHLQRKLKRGQREEKTKKYHETNGKTQLQKKVVKSIKNIQEIK